MFEFKTTVEIDRPAMEVFHYMVDPANMPEWQPGVEKATSSTPETREGSRLTDVRTFMGKKLTTTVEVVRFDEPTRFDIKVIEGPVDYEVQTSFEDLGGRTEVRALGRGEPGRMFRAAGPILKRAAERQLKKAIENLRDVLEAS